MKSLTVESICRNGSFLCKRGICIYGVCFLLVVLVYHLVLVASCIPRGGGGVYYDQTTTTRRRRGKDIISRNVPIAWGGFEVPTDVEAEWKKWLEGYTQRRIDEENENSTAYDKERGPGSGWPEGWHGLGAGFAGFPPEEPPPWSYTPINVGLPLYCYDPPVAGSCKKTIKRFAFNVYSAKCVNFHYSGCGGNRNNFVTKEACEQDCIEPPPSGCDPHTDIHIEDYTIIEDRRRNMRKCGFI